MVDNPMQEDRLVVPSSEVRGAERTVCGWTVLAGMGWLLWIYAWVISCVVLRTLATRGRKRAGPTSEAQWEGWSEAEGPKGNTLYGHAKLQKQRSAK